MLFNLEKKDLRDAKISRYSSTGASDLRCKATRL